MYECLGVLVYGVLWGGGGGTVPVCTVRLGEELT